MITTSSNVTITKTLRYGEVTTYTVNNLSLFMSHNGEQKRFTANSVTNATATSSGLVTFTNVPLWGDGSYSLYVTAEDGDDLDINGVKLKKLATGFIKKITNVSLLQL